MTNTRPPLSFSLISGLGVLAALLILLPGLRPAIAERLTVSESQPAQASHLIPWAEPGAKATAQYSGDGLSVTSAPDGSVRLRCALQKLEGEVTREGLWLTSTATGETGGRFRVVADYVGRNDGAMVALPESGPARVEQGRASYVRRGLVDEYSVSADGVRQDFVVAEPPGGAGDLRVELALSGARAEAAGRGARLVVDESGRRLTYGGLRVVDAAQRELTARIEVVGDHRLAVVVADAAALYPVRIDPTFSDANWVSLGGLPGANIDASKVVVDGLGNLYVGGSFGIIGTVAANHIAKWDGTAWSPLGSGVNGGVLALAVSGTTLYVGGDFTTAGGVSAPHIAKWDGTAWSPLGTGMNSIVSALAVSGTDLYAGGAFTTAGGVSVPYIAKWDGTGWSALGSGMNAAVAALAVSGTDLYAGGYFTTAGGVGASRIAKWDGTTWSALGSGMDSHVLALAASGTTLYAGGNFVTAGGESAHFVAKWDGSAWSALGWGLWQVYALAVSGTNLYAGGSFNHGGGIEGVAKWDGSAWSALDHGTQGVVWGLAVSGTSVYVVGDFVTAGEVGANYVARWDGSGWSALGSGMNKTVHALAVSGTDVYAGGEFTAAGGVSANCIAKWNGSVWSALGSGMRGGIFTEVNALVLSGTDLYAGGDFTTAGGVMANRIAKWNGSAWTALGSGMGGDFYTRGVNALVVSGTDLYAAGYFTTAGGVSAYYIARWDGSAWSAVGSGMDERVYALVASGTDLYAGGLFTTAGGVSANCVAKWDGSAWSSLGSGVNGGAVALAVSGTNLYAGGGFTAAGGVSANCIAKWDGISWSALGSGMNHWVNALAVSGTALHAGGYFTTAGGKVSGYVAKALLSPSPVVTATVGLLSYKANDGPVRIDNGLTVTDEDSADLVGATVSISSGFHATEDVLAFTNWNGITGEFNSTTGVLTLSCLASVANYQAALRSVTYQNTSANPNMTPRVITFVVNDGTVTGSNRRTILLMGPQILSNEAAIAIDDNSHATPYPSTITVSGVSGKVSRLQVVLRGVTHPWPGDLDILLVGPGGQSAILMSDVGGAYSIDGTDLAFDDSATNALPISAQIVAGAYKPTDYETGDLFGGPAPVGPYTASLAGFLGTTPNGTWSLYVRDDTGQNTGTIASGWTLALTLSHPMVTTTNDAGPGSLRAILEGVAPGEQITFDPVVFPPDAPATIFLTNALPPLSQGSVTIDASMAGVILDGSSVGTNWERILIDDVSLRFDGATNVLANGDFSAGMNHWSTQDFNLPGGHGRYLATDDYHSGPASYALSGQARVAGENTFYDTLDRSVATPMYIVDPESSAWIPVEPGREFALEFWHKAQGSESSVFLYALRGDGGLELVVARGLPGGTTEWAKHTMTGTVPPNCVGVVLVFYTGHSQIWTPGLDINSSGNRIRGLEIVHFTGPGLRLNYGTGNTVGGSRSHGTSPLGQGNLLSGNGRGMELYESSSNVIKGNLIGTDVTGLDALPNGDYGIQILSSSGNVVGGTTADERNIVSGNGASGIFLRYASQRNVIKGNLIGTDITGFRALGNNVYGIHLLDDCRGNVVGGNTAEECNLVSGNAGAGIVLDSNSDTNLITGNLIGTVISGNEPLGNLGGGICLYQSGYNTLGGCRVGEGNVIGGNGASDRVSDGISLMGMACAHNRVVGNYIGVDAHGESVGNCGSGITLGNSRSNLIGGSIPGAANVIAANGDNGVTLFGSGAMGNTISQNTIYDNMGRGIRLADGANNDIDPPVIAVVTTGSVEGSTGPGYTVEVFSDFGHQGRTYEGSVQADGSGHFSFSKPSGFKCPRVTATATDSSGNTSELGFAILLITTTSGALIYTENNGPWCIDGGLTLTATQGATLVGATVSITEGFLSGEDVLAFANQNGITGSYAADTGMLNLSGVASVANYQAALRSVTYQNTSANPNTMRRVITFVANDGTLTGSTTMRIAIMRLETLSSETAIMINDNNNATPYPSTITVSGLGGKVSKVQVRLRKVTHLWPDDIDILLVGPGGQKTILMSDTGGGWDINGVELAFDDSATRALPDTSRIVAGTFKPTGYETGDTFGAPAPPGPYVASLAEFAGTNPNGAWSLYVRDDDSLGTGTISGGWSLSLTLDRFLVVRTTPGALSYTGDHGSVNIDDGVTVTDEESANLDVATVSITSGFQSGEDVLAFTTRDGITGDFSSTTGVLTLSGPASVANYEKALRSVTYQNTSDSPSTVARLVTFTASDGLVTGSSDRTITVTAALPPNVAPVANPNTYTVAEDGSLFGNVITDDTGDGVDSDVEHDPLAALVDAAPAHAQSFSLNADGSFAYSPQRDFIGPDSFTYHVNDGLADSAPATVSLTVNPVNDAPSFIKGADLTVNKDAGAQSVPAWATAISAGPPDEARQVLNFLVNVDIGALFSTSPTISPDGTLAYTPATNTNGTATITVTLKDDGGTTGGGADTSAPQTFTITVKGLRPPLVLTAAGVTGGSYKFSWNVEEGRRYRLQYKTNLDDAEWTDAGLPIVATGPTAAAEDEVTGVDQRFYRLVRED